MSERGAYGLRRSPFKLLSDSEIMFLKDEIKSINADENIFRFNRGNRTSYVDDLDIIYVRANVFPDENSIHPRDLMSPRAVIAHEYYGHRANRGTSVQQGDWNDEFRANYMAAKNTPNLSVQDRAYLILDGIERTKEAGISIIYNHFIRRILYGYDEK